MQKLPNSHWELVERAERLMSETPDAERFLPAFDAALAAENDSLLAVFCRKLAKLAAGSLTAKRAA